MLIHICCSVDSHYFLEKLRQDFPNEELIGYFYNPNIHPYNEYALRLLDVKYSCEKLNIRLIEGEYDLSSWLRFTKGLEQEPETGHRCTVCFDNRLLKTVKLAKELNQTSFTTTLLISPKKSQEKLQIIGNELAKKENLEFVFKDYRSGNGVQLQSLAVKQNHLYRQNYCGCLYALNAQRIQQNKLTDEMFLPLSRQILPNSIEARYELYKKRDELEKAKIAYEVVKTRFLNYRLLQGLVEANKSVIPSYFLCYSTLNKGKSSSKIVVSTKELYYLNKDEIKILELCKLNELCNSNYKNVKELLNNGFSFEKEIKLRGNLVTTYDLSCIVVLDKVDLNAQYTINLNAKVYEDTKETIIIKENQ